MARKPDMPSEFAHFLRDLGIRAFDRVASRLEQESRPDEGMVRKLARQWSTLPPAEKERFFGYVVSAAELAEGGVLCASLDDRTVRFVTHLDVDSEAVDAAVGAAGGVLS